MTRRAVPPTLRLAVWTAGLVVTGRLLLDAGGDALSVPLTSGEELSGWLAATPPADMAIAVLRLLALAATGYLLGVTVLTLVARTVRSHGLGRAVDRVSPQLVRRLVSGGSGLGLALGAVAASAPLPDLTSTPGSATVASAAAPTDAEATMVRVDEPPATATMSRVDPSAGGAATTPATSVAPVAASPASPASASASLPALPEIDATTWVVEPGDSLWTIAESVVTPASGPAPGERDVARYWRRLIEANRDRLVDPGNADLLRPGQQLVIPPAAS